MKPQNKLLIATKNQGKVTEFKKFLKELPFEIVSLSDLNLLGKFAEKSLVLF
jgi:inosine/xanthosine triphosphate pyrophosphatase family protein